MAGKTSEKGHIASHLLVFIIYLQLRFGCSYLLWQANKESEVTNYLGLLQATHRGKDFLSPLVFSPLFLHLSKAVADLHVFVVGAELGENNTPQPVTADVTTATHCHVAVYYSHCTVKFSPLLF